MKRKFVKLSEIKSMDNAMQEARAIEPRSIKENVTRVREMKKMLAAIEKSPGIGAD